MVSETLHYENGRFAQSLFLNDPVNLKALETQLGVKVNVRDAAIRLEGEAVAVEQARHLFQQLEASLKAGSTLGQRDFAAALDMVKHEGVAALQSLHAERVNTSPRKNHVLPKTTGQKKYLQAIRTHDVTLGVGPAGTGKTYLAMAMAVSALREGGVSRIILTRPAVEAGEALGFLPGDLHEKLTPYLRPLYDALHDMLPAEEIQKHMERGSIEVAPLAYMRGRTLNNSFIVLDEAQNTTPEQMLMFLTRLGFNSKAVITGDPTQTDLPAHKASGLREAVKVLQQVEGIAVIEFSRRDIVRHPLVQRIIGAYEEHRGRALNG